MCEIIDSETYIRCGHEILCHLKYHLRYCSAPNGIPFKNPEAYNSGNFFPTRFCREETWGSRSMQINAWCKECRIKRGVMKKERMRRMEALNGELLSGGGGKEGEREEGEEEEEGEGGGEEGEDEISSLELDSGSDSESKPEDDDEKEDLAGEVVTFTECPCSLISYDPQKLQGCFEKKAPLSQMVTRAQRASDSAAQRYRSPAGTGLPVRNRSIYRSPTPPTVDRKLIKAHRATDDEEFSMAMRNELACSRRVNPSRCANCHRKMVVKEVAKMEEFRVRGEGFRRRKPKGLWVFPATDEEVAKGVVAVRGKVQS